MEHSSGNSSLCKVSGSEAGCFRDPLGPDERRSTGFDGHAFLRYRFQSNAIVAHRELAYREKVETGFFRSLHHLCSFYGMTIPDTKGLPYPVNIHEAFEQVKEELYGKGTGLSLAIFQSNHFNTAIATVKSIQTGYDLYYIPVGHIVELWEKKENKRMVDLVLCLFAFMYQKVEVPFYTEEYSFLYDCYSTVKRFIEDDIESAMEYESDLATELLDEIDRIFMAGDDLLCEISSPIRLGQFKAKADTFKPRNAKERKLLEVCQEALDFQHTYTDVSLAKVIPNLLWDEGERNILTPMMYIGFHWGTESDWLESNINEFLNCDLGEYSQAIQPSAVQFFNRRRAKESHNLTKQRALIDLLDHTASALYAFIN